ncbi:hypothetical protein [Petrocella sp. FN5]|uniref:hypothetical protein n=1 Tax=Petrocella sp. FN5 TaxID=3032002 RepID=UPI0023DA8732|nr:hypothetical protein [Petrocella sp. FN5]MDF1616541.1 hypothetical protein [Petrocella sp. FN5]
MKKMIVIGLIFLFVLIGTGCKKTVTNDIYSDTDVVVSTDGITSTEDLYGQSPVEGEQPTDEDTTKIGPVTPESLENQDVKDQLLSFLETFHYNIFFSQRDMTEGIIESDRIKFAISYIYQNEYQELRFDTSKFILYVPGQRVEEIVYEYFGETVSHHESFEEEKIVYEEGFYLMPAVDTEWNENPQIYSIELNGDNSYLVTISLYNSDLQPTRAYRTIVAVENNRYVLKSYSPIIN